MAVCFFTFMGVVLAFRIVLGLADLVHNRGGCWTLAIAQKVVDAVLEILFVQNTENAAYDLTVSINERCRRETCSETQTFHVSDVRSRPNRKGDLQLLFERRNLMLRSLIIRRSPNYDHTLGLVPLKRGEQ